jgi:hypothetical protein
MDVITSVGSSEYPSNDMSKTKVDTPLDWVNDITEELGIKTPFIKNEKSLIEVGGRVCGAVNQPAGNVAVCTSTNVPIIVIFELR